MKKIKKFFKKHYKRMITFMCVIISIFAFSLNSFADEFSASVFEQPTNVQMQLFKNDTHGVVTVRGCSPYYADENTIAYNTNINLKPSASFKFGTVEKVQFQFANVSLWMDQLLYQDGKQFLYIPFDFAFAGKSIDYFKVVGFEVRYGLGETVNSGGSWGYRSGKYTDNPSLDYVSVTRRNGQYFYSNGNKYPSYVFSVGIIVPIEYNSADLGISSIFVTLEFKGINNSSYVEYQMSNYRGVYWYNSLTDIPQNFQKPDDFEKVEIEDEKELTDNIVTDTEEGLDTFTEVVGGWRTQWGSIDDLSVCSVIWAQFLELRHISRLLYLSLAIGAFSLVFNLFNTSSRFGGK